MNTIETAHVLSCSREATSTPCKSFSQLAMELVHLQQHLLPLQILTIFSADLSIKL